jgi:hypothetical protein
MNKNDSKFCMRLEIISENIDKTTTTGTVLFILELNARYQAMCYIQWKKRYCTTKKTIV